MCVVWYSIATVRCSSQQSQSHQSKEPILSSGLGYQVVMFSRLGVLNVFLTYSIYNGFFVLSPKMG
jgi:hypothetical protein